MIKISNFKTDVNFTINVTLSNTCTLMIKINDSFIEFNGQVDTLGRVSVWSSMGDKTIKMLYNLSFKEYASIKENVREYLKESLKTGVWKIEKMNINDVICKDYINHLNKEEYSKQTKK